MFLNSSLSAALDRIAERAADVRRAFTPGAVAQYDDVAATQRSSDFTLDPLAVVAPEDAYFVARDEQGTKTYTQDGSFSVRDGKLVDAQGRSILGSRGSGGTITQLEVDPVDEALDRIRDASVERDGTFVYRRMVVDPRSGAAHAQRVVVGRVALARFPAGTRLETKDGSHCLAPADVAAQTGLPGNGGFPPLLTMHRERSRIDVDESLVRLRDAYLAFDALQAAEAAKAHAGKTTMDLLK
jgi:flagellar basal body rod protein FlgG